MPLRILHITPSYLPARRYGGTIYAVHGLCKALATLGHHVDVYTTNRDGRGTSDVPIETPQQIDGVNVTYFPVSVPKRLYFSPAMAALLRDRIDAFDVVHGHSLYLWPPWYASRLSAKRGIPYVLSPCGMLTRSLVDRRNRLIKTLWIRWIERNNFKRAAAVRFASALEAEEACAFRLSLPQYFISGNGVDMPEPAKHLPANLERVSNGGPYVLYLGRLSWKKGLVNLIRAMAQIDGPRLIVAGNDEENLAPHLRALIDTLALDDKVLLLGPVWDANKARLMHDARLFVLPSESENFGIAALEAMSVGCPVVVTRTSGVAELVARHQAGLVTDTDSDSLADAIRTLLENPVHASRCGERGRRAVAQRYGWERAAGITADCYRRLSSNAG